MKAKRWWKKDERKNGRIQRVRNTKRCFLSKITKWSKWKIHKKKTQKIENEKKKKRKNTMKQKKGKFHRNNVQKNWYSFKRRRSKKNRRDKNWIQKRCETHKKSKNIFENQGFFLKESQKKWWDVSKTKGFFWFKKLKKTKNWRCKKRPKSIKKEEEIKNTCAQKEGTMEQEKTRVQKRKNEGNKLKKGKEKGRWKTEVFF